MIEKVVRLALKQRLLILIISVVLLIAGLIATKRLYVDAFLDVTNVWVQIASKAPGGHRNRSSALSQSRLSLVR